MQLRKLCRSKVDQNKSFQEIDSPVPRKSLEIPGSPGTVSSGEGRSPCTRYSEDGERWKKNKKTIDHYIRRMASIAGKELSLNSDGLAFFAYKKFIIVIEVPPENPRLCFIYTMIYRLTPWDNQVEILKVAMELNYMQHRTRGATIGLEGEEVNLCHTIPISGLSFCSLKRALEAFLLTAVETNELLDGVSTKHDVRSDRSYNSL